jgi:hypothetical protein
MAFARTSGETLISLRPFHIDKMDAERDASSWEPVSCAARCVTKKYFSRWNTGVPTQSARGDTIVARGALMLTTGDVCIFTLQNVCMLTLKVQSQRVVRTMQAIPLF